MSDQIILTQERVLTHDPLYLNHRYGFAASYPQKNIKVHYEISIKHLRRIENGGAVYIIDRKQVSVNDVAGGRWEIKPDGRPNGKGLLSGKRPNKQTQGNDKLKQSS